MFPGPGLHRELQHLVRAGLSPVEAIRAATLDAARYLAEGKIADLLLVEGDPSADISALEKICEVFLAGVPLERTPVQNEAP